MTNALGAPDVPHSLDATTGNRQVMLSWVLPSGGAELTDYEYEQDGSGNWISTGGTATELTVRTIGQPYTFKVGALTSARGERGLHRLAERDPGHDARRS